MKKRKKMNKNIKTKNPLQIPLYVVAGLGVLLTIFIELSHRIEWLMELCGGASGSCAGVSSTSFAYILGISVTWWGLLSYLLVLFFLYRIPSMVLPMVSVMMGAELYFLWVMATILHTFCTFCLINFAIVMILYTITLLWSAGRHDFILPGKLWSAPAVAFFAFAVLAVPVKMGQKTNGFSTETLVTYQGDLKSDLKIEIFSDYECGHCKKLEPVIDKLIKNRPDVLLVFRDFILRGHKLSPVASSYVNAIAFEKGTEEFFKARSEVFENQSRLYDYLKAHLPSVTFTDELKQKVNRKVADDMKRAADVGVTATPTLAIYRGEKLVQVIIGDKSYETIIKYLGK